MSAQFAIGIDLGTTNSVLAYAPLADENATPAVLSIPQLTAPGTLEERPLLPSFTYLTAAHEKGQQGQRRADGEGEEGGHCGTER